MVDKIKHELTIMGSQIQLGTVTSIMEKEDLATLIANQLYEKLKDGVKEDIKEGFTNEVNFLFSNSRFFP